LKLGLEPVWVGTKVSHIFHFHHSHHIISWLFECAFGLFVLGFVLLCLDEGFE
jgi:hypothetical protein